MLRGALRYLGLLALLSPFGASALGDEVKLFGKPVFRNVTIRGIEDGKLTFRGVSGETLRKPLPQIEWVKSDEAPLLSAAEQALQGGQWTEAIAKLRQAENSANVWERELGAIRLIQALDRAGEFEAAVRQYITAARDKPFVSKYLMPRSFGPAGSEANRQALHEITQARAARPSAAFDAALAQLQLELSLVEDIDPLPADLRPKTQNNTTASAPARRLFGDAAPPPLAIAVELGGESPVFSAARDAASKGDHARAARLYERALPFVDPRDPQIDTLRAEWQRSRLETGQAAEAASELMSLSERTRDPLLAARALYNVGLAHERLNRPNVARGIYRRLAERADLPDELRSMARDGLERVGN